ncbi:TraR/DksA C4-type zinc finger protein [Streptomyces sp. NPDC004610]|uniref:TraR/DksA family transcriptional regulator n=1 Tax=unclassified Streptomyces TaxID=2593676 RepID=UPI0033BE0485
MTKTTAAKKATPKKKTPKAPAPRVSGREDSGAGAAAGRQGPGEAGEPAGQQEPGKAGNAAGQHVPGEASEAAGQQEPGEAAGRQDPGEAAGRQDPGEAGSAAGRQEPGGVVGRTSTAKSVDAAEAAEQTGAKTVVAKKTPGAATAATTAVPKARPAAEPGELAVRPGEDPWTPEEVAEARTELITEMERLRSEISSTERSLVGLMRDSGDGAGDDQADTGTKNITREHELALAANAREMLLQTERALQRLDAGTYGLCENCGKPIGKARMQAFPRATLCVECKQKQERRY